MDIISDASLINNGAALLISGANKRDKSTGEVYVFIVKYQYFNKNLLRAISMP